MKVLITDEQSLFRDGLSLRLKQINQDIAILQSSNLVDMQKILSKEPDIDILIVDIDLAELKNKFILYNRIWPVVSIGDVPFVTRSVPVSRLRYLF